VGQPEDKSSGYQMEGPMIRPCLEMNDKTSQGWLASCNRDVYVPVGDEDLINFERKNYMNEITLQSVISGKKEIVAADMDGDTVMMSVEAGKYYNLGTTGGMIWKMLESPISVGAVIAKLLEQYEVTQEQCETDVLSFFNRVNQEGLLEVQ
jgi:hypothetical protein